MGDQKLVYVSSDPLAEPTCHEVDDVCRFLLERFPTWPKSARIYHGAVALTCDVTPPPRNREAIARLQALPGPFYVVVYPSETITFAGVVKAGLLILASYALTQIFKPSLPEIHRPRVESPNNWISSRQNRERLGGRIPDIFGKLRAYPDLLAVPWTHFESHEEVEEALYCLGRGTYEIHDVKDGDTEIQTIRGAAVQIWNPGQKVPGDPPQAYDWGNISGPVLFPRRCTAVTGQELVGQNDQTLTEWVQFCWPNEIRIANADSTTDFTSLFSSDGKLTLTNALLTRPESGTFRVFFQAMTRATPSLCGILEFASGQTLPAALTVGTLITLGSVHPGIYLVYAINGNQVALKNDPNGGHADSYPWYDATDWTNVAIEYGGEDNVADLAGTYDVLSVDPRVIVLDRPEKVNSDWSAVQEFGGTSAAVNSTLSMAGLRWVGPFTIEYPNFTKLVLNFVAEQGLYSLDEKNTQYGAFPDPAEPLPVSFTEDAGLCSSGKVNGVRVRIGVQRLNDDGTELGLPELWDAIVEGSAVSRRVRARTVTVSPSWAVGVHSGKCSVKVARVTRRLVNNETTQLEEPYDNDTYVDVVNWRDLYAMCEHPGTSFGDVTVVRTSQRASVGLFAVKERRLSALVTRKVRYRLADGTISEPTNLAPSRSAADILCHVCLDPQIGARTVDEIDVANVYDSVALVVQHFSAQSGLSLDEVAVCGEFAYSFDDSNTSFEETVAAIAEAVFCTAYRRGSLIRLKPDLPTSDSTLLFNHRNKLPGSEVRVRRVGRGSSYDGVEFVYTSPKDETRATVQFPADGSARNPERVDSIGVRSRIQAYYHGARRWMRQKHERVFVEFEALEEAKLLAPRERFLCADGTRSDSQEAEVVEVDATGRVLTLSQSVFDDA